MTIHIGPPSAIIEMGVYDATPGCEEFLSSLPGYDPSYEIVHYDEWSDYEEWAWYAILRKDGQLYEVSGGHCVMGESGDDVFDPQPTCEEAVLEQMIDWEAYHDEHNR